MICFEFKCHVANDVNIIVSQIMKLPCGQLNKVLSEDVLAVLTKYGYGE